MITPSELGHQNQGIVKEKTSMDQATHNKIVSFIWGMEPTKKNVLETKKMLDAARIAVA